MVGISIPDLDDARNFRGTVSLPIRLELFR
jgi:hypothetical protein